jgi:CheY-like chemotaxis protein
MVASMLTIDGFVVVEADSGEGALSAMEDEVHDVIVVDYKMPGLDGVETARRIKAKRADQTIILYTAFPDPAAERLASEAGIAACVAKMDGLAVLTEEIVRLVGPR